MAQQKIKLKAGEISLALLRQVAGMHVQVELHSSDYEAIHRSRETVDTLYKSEQTTYGINTGFGKLAQTHIPEEKLSELQRNLLLSHSCGVGELLDDNLVRLIMVLKVLSLARGHSGVRSETVDALLALINYRAYPCIPAKGSVGASGDLAPLAHMSAALIGIGEMRIDDKIIPAAEGLERAGLSPLELGPKEGLALINGTQVSTALALYHLFAIEDIFASAVISGSLSVDAMKGSVAPFDPRIHQLRGQIGQIDIAAVYRHLLQGSEILASHIDCVKVQDPYSLRCQPQVMGAILDSIRHAGNILCIEANAVTDNPLIFPDTNEALSGGNFHAEPVAIVADQLAVAIAETGALSERRIANLVDPTLSLLPAFLVDDPGLNSGFMIAHVTAAALASENKSLAHPASVDSLPTSANQEDHVSMATYAARRLGTMADNTAGIIAIELLAATQAIDFHQPCTTSPQLQDIVDKIRTHVPNYHCDRYFAPDIEYAKQLVTSGQLTAQVQRILPSYA